MSGPDKALSDSNIAAAAVAFLSARQSRAPIAHLPEACRPQSLRDAYRIQQAFDRRCGKSIAGYKIGAASAASPWSTDSVIERGSGSGVSNAETSGRITRKWRK